MNDPAGVGGQSGSEGAILSVCPGISSRQPAIIAESPVSDRLYGDDESGYTGCPQ